MTDIGAGDVAPQLDESARRRRRTDAYCQMWVVPLIAGEAPVLVSGVVAVRTSVAVRARVLAFSLCALKGQGLSQHEVFAMADALSIWDGLTVAESDFVLDPAPSAHELVQAAWRFEAVNVLLWAIGSVRHLAFPDTVVDSGGLTSSALGLKSADSLRLRSEKELLDAADVARRLRVVGAAVSPPPAGMLLGVLYERAFAFDWLLGLAEL